MRTTEETFTILLKPLLEDDMNVARLMKFVDGWI